MTDDQLRRRVPNCQAAGREELLEAALEEHLYRTICELFGKDDGYCRGRGGSMHIADFTVGHLGANAIVGGGVPIATGAALANRYLERGNVVCCFAGDGAYANGVVLESLNFAAQAQFTNHLADGRKRGLPIVFLVCNNHYGMTGRCDDEVMGVERIARRAAGFASNNMHAEVVNGMNVLAARDAVRRAAGLCRQGQGPVLLDVDCYRYWGHSLSDPRNEYRTREEEAAWRAVDPIESYKKALLAAKVLDAQGLAAVERRVAQRNARAATRAAAAADPAPEDVLTFMYTDTKCETVPKDFADVTPAGPLPEIKRVNGELTYKDALKEALVQEMLRDKRVIFYGEDVADYGGAFKVTKGLLEAFGRERVFNTPISEACICGTGCGAAMNGLRPVVELMYFDFALMSSDQISNQAAKWHYMSGAQTEVPLVIRASAGAGKGYGGQHSQTLESVFCHIPGLYVVYPATPYDAKGLLKAAIRDNNPVLFVESQALYGLKGPVPEGGLSGAAWPGRSQATGHRPHPGGLGPRSPRLPQGGGQAQGRAGGQCRGHRPAQPRAAGPRNRFALGAKDRPLRRGQPGRPHRQLHRRDCLHDPGPGLRLPRRPGQTRRRQKRHRPPVAHPRGGVPPQRR